LAKDRPPGSSQPSAPSAPSPGLPRPHTNSLKVGDERRACSLGSFETRLLGVLRLAQIHPGHLLQPSLAEAGEKDRCDQGAQPLVCADVGRGLFSSNVFAPSVASVRTNLSFLSGQRSRLPTFRACCGRPLPGRKKFEVGSSERGWHAEALAFTRHDVGPEFSGGVRIP